jgi:hypothetical protein
MNPKAPHPFPIQPTIQPLAQHLNHDQLCDVLLHDDLDIHALHGDVVFSTAAADQLAAFQEHLRNCLICSAELDIMRGAVARFQTTADTLTARELDRRPLPAPFSSLISARSRSYSAPAFVWAAAALLVASLLPLSLLHLKPNPLLRHPGIAPQTSSTATADAQPVTADVDSDAALLDDINQHLSASVPEPMQPLASPAATAETVSMQESN